jgi:hypothetical protein
MADQELALQGREQIGPGLGHRVAQRHQHRQIFGLQGVEVTVVGVGQRRDVERDVELGAVDVEVEGGALLIRRLAPEGDHRAGVHERAADGRAIGDQLERRRAVGRGALVSTCRQRQREGRAAAWCG